MSDETLTSKNKLTILDILDDLRRRVDADEILQLFVGVEDVTGYDCQWSDSEDRIAIAAFVLSSAIARMGFAKAPDPE